jgi:hypothetical protein
MNQKGEVTLMASLLLFILLGIVLLCSLELKKSFYQLQKRTELFLCFKETKGELNEFIKFTGRTNWAIKNLSRAELIMMFIPLGQTSAISAKNLKNFLIKSQEFRLISYMNRLKNLNSKGCKLDFRMFISPFELATGTFRRDKEQAVILRKKEWSYSFYSKPYFLILKINSQRWENPSPHIKYISEEKTVTPPSTSLSAFLSAPLSL